MRDRQTCVGCGKKSPETETNYTLISAQFGWRLARYKSADGELVVEWRCPTCWREYKRARATAAGDTHGARPSQPPPADSSPPPRGSNPPPRMPTLDSYRVHVPSSPSPLEASRRPPTPVVPPPRPAPPRPAPRSAPPPPSTTKSTKPPPAPATGRPGRTPR